MITEPFVGQRIKIRAWDLMTVPYARLSVTEAEYHAGKTFYCTITELRCSKASIEWDDKRLRYIKLSTDVLMSVTPDEDIILSTIEQAAQDDFAELRQQFME